MYLWYNGKEICEVLYQKNKDLFRDIVKSYAIKGRKNVYIAFANDYAAQTIGNKLNSHRCKVCEKNYIADTVFKGYTKNKNLDNLNIRFVEKIL